jgi:hypothetical protein
MLMERNTHPKVPSEMLGHSTVYFTMDTYQHVQSSFQQTAAPAIRGSGRLLQLMGVGKLWATRPQRVSLGCLKEAK